MNPVFDINSLYNQVIHTTGYTLHENEPRQIYALPTKVRANYIPESLGQYLQRTSRTWTVSEYLTGGQTLKKEDCHALREAALSQEATAHTLLELPQDQALVGFNWISNGSNSELTLPSASGVTGEQKISIVNSDEKGNLIIHGSEKKLTLLPGEGAIFIRSVEARFSPKWTELGQYGHFKDFVITNPLIRDEPVLRRDGEVPSSKPLQGEYFLPIELVKNLAEKKLKGVQDGVPIFSLNQVATPFINDIKDRLSNASDTTCSLLIHNPDSEHILATRLIRRGNDLVCYLHEGLDQTDSRAREIQTGLCSVLHKAFPDTKIRCLTPTQVMQRDFYSCGVFALKGLMAFDKIPGFDDFMFVQALAVAQPAERGNFLDKSSCDTLRKYSDTQVTAGSLPLSKLPARLLKLYQGKCTALGYDQLNTVVSKKTTTLGQYFEQNKRRIVHCEKNIPLDVHLAAFGKRYKYAIEWYNDKRGSEHVPSDAIVVPIEVKRMDVDALAVGSQVSANEERISESDIENIEGFISDFAWGEACGKAVNTCVQDYVLRQEKNASKKWDKKLFLSVLAFSFLSEDEWKKHPQYVEFLKPISHCGDGLKNTINKIFGSGANKNFIYYSLNKCLVDNKYVDQLIVVNPTERSTTSRSSASKRKHK